MLNSSNPVVIFVVITLFMLGVTALIMLPAVSLIKMKAVKRAIYFCCVLLFMPIILPLAILIYLIEFAVELLYTSFRLLERVEDWKDR